MRQAAKDTLRSSPAAFHAVKWAYLQAVHIFSRLKWRQLRRREAIYLDLGSGPRAGRGEWVTVDQSGADIAWDLRKGIPLAEGSVARIYSSHLLEHIPFEQLLPFLAECRRVLADGGEFSVCVPNAGYYIRAYAGNTLFRERDSWHPPARVDTGSRMDQVNYIAYMGGEHHYMFDEENLVNTLLKSGFRKAALREFDASQDSPERDFESIYAIAVK